MATRSRKNSSPDTSRNSPAGDTPIREAVGTVLATFSGPSTKTLRQGEVADLDTESQRRLATQKIGAQEAAAAIPANPLKAGEHGLDGGHSPQPGTPVPPHDPIDTASTVSEDGEPRPRWAEALPRRATTPATNRSTAPASTPAAGR